MSGVVGVVVGGFLLWRLLGYIGARSEARARLSLDEARTAWDKTAGLPWNERLAQQAKRGRP